MQIKHQILSVLPLVMLTACGGDGGSSTAPVTPPATLQGAYVGTNSAGVVYNTLILEDGSFYSFYGNIFAFGLLVNGVASGQTTSSNGSWNVTYNDFPNGTFYASGTGSGTYTDSSMTGSNTENGQERTFTLYPPSSTAYIYNTPAQISSITGYWYGSATDGSSNNWVINADGTFSALSSTGCTYTGTFTPRPSNVNVFNVTMTLGPSPCAVPGLVISGVAIDYLLSNGQTELVTIVSKSSQYGVGIFGVR